MTRHRPALAAALICSLLAGCTAEHRRPNTLGTPQRRSTDHAPDAGDLILVRQRETPPAGAQARVPRAAVDRARRFTVAVRALRPVVESGDRPRTPTVNQPAGDPAARATVTLVEGSGVVISRAGLVLTNHHVVRGSADLRVWSDPAGWQPARLLAADPASDLAVLALDQRLPAAARLAERAPLRVDEPVVAIGYTPGCDVEAGPTVLAGRLASLHHSLQRSLDPRHGAYYGDLLASTVPLEPGHSGGALVDRTGAVIGLNTAAARDYRTGARTGYAIPVTGYAREVINRLVRGERVIHGYLGLLLRTAPAASGAVPVAAVVPGGPAEAAGLRPGDAIVSFDGRNVGRATDLAAQVRAAPIGRPVPIVLRRAGTTVTLACMPEPRPAP